MPHAQQLANEPPAPSRSGRDEPLPQADSLAAFGLQVSRHFALSRREGEPLALLWVEIEALESPGSAMGAVERDSLVRTASQRLRNRVRNVDEVVRVGNQGFAVLLMAAGAREAAIAAQRLLQSLRGTYGVDGRQLQVAVRLGTAVFPQAGRNGAELAESARRDLIG